MTDLKKTARTTGLWYLGLAIGGVIGQIFVLGELYVAGDASATAANLVDHEALARVGIVADMAIVVTQTLVALWFFRLFRAVNSFAAGSLAAFGFVNAIVGLIGVVFTATALDLAVAGGDVERVGMLYDLRTSAWGVGALFFGLWLIPMGTLVLESGYMPRALGWILVVGGGCYVLSAFTAYAWPSAPGAVAGVLTTLPSIGEFWIIGYLLTFGVRASHTVAASRA